MTSLHLHQRVRQELHHIGVRLPQPQLTNLALVCQALALSSDCHLANLALQLPVRGQREYLIQRLRRFLATEELKTWSCYRPVVRYLFRHWHGREVALVMDRTDIENRFSILTLGATYRKRLLPLTWDIVPFGSTDATCQLALIQRVQPLLPSLDQVRIHFYADCEFRAVELQRTCRDYGWHWQVGLKSDELVYHPDWQSWQSLAEWGVSRGQRRYLQGIYLTRRHIFGRLNLIANWHAHDDYPRFWALDLPADPQAFRRGRKRFWCEPMFRDWKSYGFDLERTQLEQAQRLDTLVLGIALTTLWLIHVGDWLIERGRVGIVAPPTKADYSVFRIGRDYLARCRTQGWHIPLGFSVSHAA